MTDPSRSAPTPELKDLVTAWLDEQRKIASGEAERLGRELATTRAELAGVRRELVTAQDELVVAKAEIDKAWKQIARFRTERDRAESACLAAERACLAAERALKIEKEAREAARVTFAKVIETVREAPPPSALAQALSEVLNETRGSLSGEQYARLQKAIEDAKPAVTPSAPTIANLARRAHEKACAKGWWDSTSPDGRWTDPGTVPRCLALIHSEVSEALEAWRVDDKASTTGGGPDGTPKPDGFIAELADVVIRVFDTAEALGMNLEEAVLAKMKFNETRSHKHGGKRA